jgi:hypothetical protein
VIKLILLAAFAATLNGVHAQSAAAPAANAENGRKLWVKDNLLYLPRE